MINFNTIRWKNMLSTGNQFTEIKLDRSPSTLIVGENGGGKSTMLDALCFALFNKPFRNINKPQLINSINKKNLLVEIEFQTGRKSYKIVRGIRPNLFEIYADGELLNQDAAARDYQKYLEESILKMNYKSFTQIVILGSASFTPFMQLPAFTRREIIEDILDIQIFTTMNSVLKDKIIEINRKKTFIKPYDIANGYYKFYVEDNGPGIASSHHEQIFKIFEVATLKDKFGVTGNGIGLATVKNCQSINNFDLKHQIAHILYLLVSNLI